jgi:hypothetical protein
MSRIGRWEKWWQIALPTTQALKSDFFLSEELQQHDDDDFGPQLVPGDDGFDLQQQAGS